MPPTVVARCAATVEARKVDILVCMAILLFAVVAFLVMRLAIPQLKSASNLKLATFALPCALAGWLLMSMITNIALRAN